MILGINYANEKFKKAQKLNSWSMIHKGMVDKVIEYNPDILDKDFCNNNKNILSYKRCGGYWIWKPYILCEAIKTINDSDYLFYCDSGAVVIDSVMKLINSMENASQEVMSFELRAPEKNWSKRDAFIVLDCDYPKYIESPQRLSSYIIIKKNHNTENLLREFLYYAINFRIITDDPNTMGLPNYEGFIENRHDQTIWSLLTKKHGYLPFRDPSQFGVEEKYKNQYAKDTIIRSTYPMIIDSHRNGNLTNWTSYKIYRKLFWLINTLEKMRKRIKRLIA